MDVYTNIQHIYVQTTLKVNFAYADTFKAHYYCFIFFLQLLHLSIFFHGKTGNVYNEIN